MKHLTDFRKTLETGVDPRLLLERRPKKIVGFELTASTNSVIPPKI